MGEEGRARSADSATVRDELLAAIRRRRPEFEAAGKRAEELRTLPPDVVATLREMGVFWLKTPTELGGTPLEPLDFCDVMEELAYADPATAWMVMVGNGGTGTAGGWLPDAGARRVFTPGRPRPLVVGTPGPRGAGRPVAGGFLVSGRWGFASGRPCLMSWPNHGYTGAVLPRPSIRSIRPCDRCCSIAYSSATRTGSFVVISVVDVVTISLLVVAAM